MSNDAPRTSKPRPISNSSQPHHGLDRRSILLGGTTLAAASALEFGNPIQVAQAQRQPAPTPGQRPNIIFIMGDDMELNYTADTGERP